MAPWNGTWKAPQSRTKDRLRGELDFAVNRRAASDIQGLAGKLNLLVEKVGDLDDELRARKL